MQRSWFEFGERACSLADMVTCRIPERGLMLVLDERNADGSFVLADILRSAFHQRQDVVGEERMVAVARLVSTDRTFVHYASVCRKGTGSVGVDLRAMCASSSSSRGVFSFVDARPVAVDGDEEVLKSTLAYQSAITVQTAASTSALQSMLSSGLVVSCPLPVNEVAVGDDEHGMRSQLRRMYEVMTSPVPHGQRPSLILVDNVSTLSLFYGIDGALQLIHYLRVYADENNARIVCLAHQDIGEEDVEGLKLLMSLRNSADCVVSVSELETGMSKDVHGQLTVAERCGGGQSSSPPLVLHFKCYEHGVNCFPPGTLPS